MFDNVIGYMRILHPICGSTHTTMSKLDEINVFVVGLDILRYNTFMNLKKINYIRFNIDENVDDIITFQFNKYNREPEKIDYTAFRAWLNNALDLTGDIGSSFIKHGVSEEWLFSYAELLIMLFDICIAYNYNDSITNAINLVNVSKEVVWKPIYAHASLTAYV